MPLLDDAKTCYVGTQPITRILAGTSQVWVTDGRDCDDAGKPPSPGNFRVATYAGDASKYACVWQWVMVPGATDGWKIETELKLSGTNAWTNKKLAEYPFNYLTYNKTAFGPNATAQRQTEVRARNIDASGNASCYVYEFPRD